MKCLILIAVLAAFGEAVSSLQQPALDVFSEQAAQLIRSARLPDERLQVLPILLQHLKIILRTRWPGSEVVLFGSIATGLAVRGSDADCTVFLPQRHDTSATLADEARHILRQFPQLFANFSNYPRVSIPVFSFHHVPTRFQADLTFNNYRGTKSVELFNYAFWLDERNYIFSFIVKYWGKVHKVTGSDSLPSYGLIALVLFYLQQLKMMPSLESLQKNAYSYFIDEWNFGFDHLQYDTQKDIPLNLLLDGFFKYYSSFNFDKYIISPYVGYPVEKTLFEDVNKVTYEFNLYVENVKTNVSQPLSVTNGVIIQDFFQHNVNVAENLDSKPNSTFITQFKNAAKKFQKNYLDKIFET